MLACMETKLGMMVLGPQGQRLRLQTNHPAFRAGRDILRLGLPAEQAWQKLQDLVANPYKALVDWCERFGLTFKDEGLTLRLNDVALNREQWLPLLGRMHAAGGSPAHVLQFAETMGLDAGLAHVGEVTLHLREDKLRGLQPALLKLVNLPAEARRGDLVNATSTGAVPFLVSFDSFSVSPTGELLPQRGMVLAQVTNETEAADILKQPAILGFNRTYRCEEGTPDGWLEDMSFDSLEAARLNAKGMQSFGAEVRIVNRITGEVIPLN